MPHTNSDVIAQCPNPKCSKPIRSDHPYSWCSECGEPLPDNIKEKLSELPKPVQQASTPSAMGQAKQIFQCPNCSEYINTSMKECRFCGSPVDYNAALAAAQIREKIDRACNDARIISTVIWLMPVAWVSCGIIYLAMQEIGFAPLAPLLFPLIATIKIIGWWGEFGSIQTDDPDFEEAKGKMKVTLGAWVAMVPIPLIIFIIWISN